MLIGWRDEWYLGIAAVDDEHRALVDRFNRIALRVGCRPSTVGNPGDTTGTDVIALLEDLVEIARSHFRHEEECMQDAAYPGLPMHRDEHVTLLAEFAELLREIRGDRLPGLNLHTLRALKRWLTGHVAGSDRRFAEYYHAQDNRVSGAQGNDARQWLGAP